MLYHENPVVEYEKSWGMRLDQVRKTLTPDNWLTRAKIAHALGRKRLNALDLAALAVLEALGQIEVEQRPDPRPVGYITLYRLKNGAHDEVYNEKVQEEA